MTHIYPIRLADQLREHLRSLRKTRGLTQAQVGATLGVSQARIAEIEANPGLVNFDQLLQLLAYLGCSVCLEVDVTKPEVPSATEGLAVAETRSQYPKTAPLPAPPQHVVLRKKKGSW